MEKNEEIFSMYLSKEAANRFSRIQSVDENHAKNIMHEIMREIKSGKISRQISEEEFLAYANRMKKIDSKKFNFARRRSFLDFN